MKQRTWIIDDDHIYRTCFALKVGGTKRQAFEWLARKLQLEVGEDQLVAAERSRASGSFLGRTGYTTFAIWLRDAPETPGAEVAATIAHEALHATFHVMEAVGIGQITEASEEAFCYFQGYLVREIHRRLWPAAKPQEKSSK